ncbi:MAG: DNA polymerase I [Campylobacterales bacterium]|nr:DNA polymerase I [Campylobacterales bacterium]
MSKPVLTIIDTFGFFFRSFYALPPLSNSAGFPTGLLTGFANFISNLHREHGSDYIAFALDAKGPTFRSEIDPNYKANRPSPPEELVLQLPVAIDWIEKMGFTTLSRSGFEADDIIASLTQEALRAGMNVRIVSHDKDLYQLIEDDHVVLYDAIKRKIINEAECLEKHGVHPAQFTDFQALLGDSADNVPGVKGIGKVTAQKLIETFGSLSSIYRNIDAVTPAGVQKKLRENEPNAWMSQKLVTLRRDLFDTFDFEPLRMQEQNPFVAIAQELAEYEMNGILRQLQGKNLLSAQAPKVQSKTESTAFKTTLLQDDAALLHVTNKLRADQVVAFDTETTGLEHERSELVGFSFAFEEGEGYYVPLRHSYLGVGAQVGLEAAKAAVEKILTCKVIGHNIKFDLHFLADWLGRDDFALHADTMILAWLDNPEQSLSLDALCERHFAHKMIRFSETVKKGENFASVALEEACRYAAEDAVMTLRLYKLYRAKLQERGDILGENERVEVPFISTLLRLERAGIMIDEAVLGRFRIEASARLGVLSEAIYAHAGGSFNINSPKQLSTLLFETLGLQSGKKTKTGYSTDESVLAALSGAHPIIAPLLEYRELFKLLSTYIDPLLDLCGASSDKRIHTSFVHTGTATGRLSSKNPNLQNIPTKTELGRRIREAFVAPQGRLLIGIDYSQIELRLLAHFSQDAHLLEAFNAGLDIHRQTAVKLFGEEQADAKRFVAKTINFGLLYGMGPKKLSETLGIDMREAKGIIDRYFESFPSVRGYFASIVEGARSSGYVQTLLGRRRYFDFASATPMQRAAYEREAVNTLFQGSAADLIKLSMNHIDALIREEGLHVKMLLQIHDELLFEAPSAEAQQISERFGEIMERIYTLHVTLKTSRNIAPHWGALK